MKECILQVKKSLSESGITIREVHRDEISFQSKLGDSRWADTSSLKGHLGLDSLLFSFKNVAIFEYPCFFIASSFVTEAASTISS